MKNIIQNQDVCNFPGLLEVNTPYSATQFLLVSGLERESESFFSSLVSTLVDGHTFLFAGNREEKIFQVGKFLMITSLRHLYIYII